MKVLFHSKALNYRGVTNSIVDYAKYNQELLGNESAIVYKVNFDTTGLLDAGSNLDVINKIAEKFPVYCYEDQDGLNRIAELFDVFYDQKAGLKDDVVVTSTRTAVHCVFQYYEPHGDSYAYISEWLAREMNKQCPQETLKWVPYIVNLPSIIPGIRETMRNQLGIPQDAFVIGRHGGLMTFDIQWVNAALPRLCEKYPNLWFIFANTFPVQHHPRIIYSKPFFGDVEKTVFISTCDAALHGRTLGETFGASICENLFHNKPVIAWEGGFDRNHVELLRKYDFLYNEENLDIKIANLMMYRKFSYDFSETTNPFSSERVMQKFKEVFLDY